VEGQAKWRTIKNEWKPPIEGGEQESRGPSRYVRTKKTEEAPPKQEQQRNRGEKATPSRERGPTTSRREKQKKTERTYGSAVEFHWLVKGEAITAGKKKLREKNLR